MTGCSGVIPRSFQNSEQVNNKYNAESVRCIFEYPPAAEIICDTPGTRLQTALSDFVTSFLHFV
jgi:hypothetical protein